MKAGFLILIALLLFPAGKGIAQEKKPIPPGLQQGEQAVQKGSNLPPPMQFSRRKIEAAKLRREAKELKQLATTVQKQIGSVNQGEFPATLPKNLKKIAEITHHLRLQISQ
jgi:hypothetical protein